MLLKTRMPFSGQEVRDNRLYEGLSLVSIARVGDAKGPLIKNWQNIECFDTTATYGARKMNVGLKTGVGSVFCLDFDIIKEKDRGSKYFDESKLGMFLDQEEYEGIVRKLKEKGIRFAIQQSGSGGKHLFFKYSDKVAGMTRDSKIPGFKNKVDYCNERSQVLVYPSVNNEGGKYKWEYKPDNIERLIDLDEMPGFLLTMVQQKKEEPKQKEESDDEGFEEPKGLSDKILALLCEHLSIDKVKDNHDEKIKIMWMVRSKIDDLDETRRICELWYDHMNDNQEAKNKMIREIYRAVPEKCLTFGSMKRTLVRLLDITEKEASKILKPVDGRLKGNNNKTKSQKAEIEELNFLNEGLKHAERVVQELPSYFIHNGNLYYFDPISKLYKCEKDEILKKIIAVKTEKIIRAILEEKELIERLDDYKKFWEVQRVNNILSFVRADLLMRSERFNSLNRKDCFLPIRGGKEIDLRTFKITDRGVDNMWSFERDIEENYDPLIFKRVKDFVSRVFWGERIEFKKYCSLMYETDFGFRQQDEFFVLFLGDPSAGKTTLMMLNMAILGDELSLKDSIKRIEMKKEIENDNHHGAYAVKLMPIRHLWMDETKKNKMVFDEQKLKADYSNRGAKVQARPAGVNDYVRDISRFTLWITTNHRPSFDDVGIRRRIRAITATAKFVGDEDGAKPDPKRGIFQKVKNPEFFSPKYLFALLYLMFQNYDPKYCAESVETSDLILNEVSRSRVAKADGYWSAFSVQQRRSLYSSLSGRVATRGTSLVG